MTEPIRINADVLREVADGHDEVVTPSSRTARERGSDILAAVESYGPIMHEVKAAVGDLLLDRDNGVGRARRPAPQRQRRPAPCSPRTSTPTSRTPHRSARSAEDPY